MKAVILLLCTLSFWYPAPASAEIVKSSVPCDGKNCLYWWPKAPAPDGWHQDRKASDAGGIYALAPDGSTFETAETVIYAKAMYKPLVPTIRTLEQLISDDKRDFLRRDPKLTISGPEILSTGDGTGLRNYTFSTGGDGNWEEVAYGEEDEFYLIFTVSSDSQAGLTGSRKAYLQLIKAYRGNP